MLNSLSASDFEQFLGALDLDRNQAAEKYLALRARLEKFFEWRGCDNTEDLTDIVFDRVTKKIIGGEEIKNAEAYCVSVAKFVLLENRREILRNRELDENKRESGLRENDATAEEGEFEEKQFKCLEECLAKLSSDKRELIISYFDTVDEETLIPARQSLAEKMGINLNSLRIRISRLKSKLEMCTRECCDKA